jgi:membrane associated rhomboid family serine protease
MIPFRDNIPSRRTPVLTVVLIALNVLVFLLEMRLPPQDREAFIYRWGAVPYEFQIIGEGPQAVRISTQRFVRRGRFVEVVQGFNEFQVEGTLAGAVVPLFTSMFLHGGLMHLIGNMWFLWLFGDNIEDRLGRVRYLALYLLSGLAAGVSQVYANWGEYIPMIGASGAVAGVLGAYMVTYPYARVLAWVPFFFFFWPVVEMPAVMFLAIWFLIQFLQGTASLAGPYTGGVAWWAHVGGFIAGILLMWLLAPEPPERRGPRWTELEE